MDELKTLFGTESIDYATFEQRLTEKGIKLGNISGGAYVAADKYSKLQRDFDKYKSENDVSRYSDYDTIKNELETLKAAAIENEYLNTVTAAGVTEKFRKFVVSEVKGLVTDKKTFADCLTEYLKNNEQFVEKSERKGGFFQTGVNLNGGGEGKKTTAEKMNSLIKGAIGK